MSTYETLDAIADSYIPLLAVLVLLLLLREAALKHWCKLGAGLGLTLIGLVITYGLMFLDMKLQIWPAFGLDYSTHTALAIVLTMLLVLMTNAFTALWIGLLLAYSALMLYQRYHTLEDIVVTALAVSFCVLPFVYLLRRRLLQPRSQNN
jgi:hypothetical protein